MSTQLKSGPLNERDLALIVSVSRSLGLDPMQVISYILGAQTAQTMQFQGAFANVAHEKRHGRHITTKITVLSIVLFVVVAIASGFVLWYYQVEPFASAVHPVYQPVVDWLFPPVQAAENELPCGPTDWILDVGYSYGIAKPYVNPGVVFQIEDYGAWQYWFASSENQMELARVMADEPQLDRGKDWGGALYNAIKTSIESGRPCLYIPTENLVAAITTPPTETSASVKEVKVGEFFQPPYPPGESVVVATHTPVPTAVSAAVNIAVVENSPYLSFLAKVQTACEGTANPVACQISAQKKAQSGIGEEEAITQAQSESSSDQCTMLKNTVSWEEVVGNFGNGTDIWTATSMLQVYRTNNADASTLSAVGVPEGNGYTVCINAIIGAPSEVGGRAWYTRNDDLVRESSLPFGAQFTGGVIALQRDSDSRWGQAGNVWVFPLYIPPTPLPEPTYAPIATYMPPAVGHIAVTSVFERPEVISVHQIGTWMAQNSTTVLTSYDCVGGKPSGWPQVVMFSSPRLVTVDFTAVSEFYAAICGSGDAQAWSLGIYLGTPLPAGLYTWRSVGNVSITPFSP